MSTPVYGGHEVKLYYVEETNYGETPATPDMHGVGSVISVEPALNPSNIKVRGLGSRDLQFIRKGLRQVNLKINYHPFSITFLEYVTTLKALSVEVIYEKTSGIIDLLHKGCRINTATVDCSVEDMLKVTAELIGQDVIIGTAKIGASYTDHEAAVSFYESYVKKGTTTLERVTDFKFVITNNLKRVPVIRTANGNLLKYLPERHRNLTGEVTFEFETKEEFDDVINDTDFTLEFGLGGTHKATFTNCKWESVSPPTRIEDFVALKAPFVGKGVTIT